GSEKQALKRPQKPPRSSNSAYFPFVPPTSISEDGFNTSSSVPLGRRRPSTTGRFCRCRPPLALTPNFFLCPAHVPLEHVLAAVRTSVRELQSAQCCVTLSRCSDEHIRSARENVRKFVYACDAIGITFSGSLSLISCAMRLL